MNQSSKSCLRLPSGSRPSARKLPAVNCNTPTSLSSPALLPLPCQLPFCRTPMMTCQTATHPQERKQDAGRARLPRSHDSP